MPAWSGNIRDHWYVRRIPLVGVPVWMGLDMILRGRAGGRTRFMMGCVAGAAVVLGGLLTASAVLPTDVFGAVLLQSTTYEARAVDRLDARGEPALAQAKRDTRSGLGLNPYNGVAWLRLAWIETAMNGGRLSPAAAVALQRSYDVAPYGPQITGWRITFVLDHWADVPEAIRSQLRSEISAGWPARASVIDAAVRRAHDKRGRLAGRVVLARIRAGKL